MNLLLDTNAILHLAHDAERLSEHTRQKLLAPENQVFCSVITAGELACLSSRGRLSLRGHWSDWLRREIAEAGWIVLPITLEIMEAAFSLPEPLHRDPADRILIATARVHELVLVTTDRLILDYPHVHAVS